MQVYGVDLARWWRGRRWVALLELIDQLPAASRLNEAIMNDPESAELIARAQEQVPESEREQWAPPLREYDLHAQLLRDTVQALMGVQAAIVAAAGGNPGQVTYPAPRTEIDRAVARINREWAESIIDIFTPGRGGQ